MAKTEPDDDLILDIPADEPDKGTKTGAEPAKNSEDEGVAALKARVEEARKLRETDKLAREESERRATALEQENVRTRQEMATVRAEASSDRLATIAAAIDSVTRESEMATAKLEKAALDGDYKALAVAQRELSRAEARLVALENSKEQFAADIAANKTKNAQQERQPTVQRDPIDNYIASLTSKSAVWMAQHRDLVLPTGQPKQELIAAHNLAMARGHAPDSDGYFAYIGKKIDDFRAEDNDNEPEEGTVVDISPRRSASTAAPVSREGSSSSGSTTRVRLSPAEVEAAEIAGMTPAEYAKSKMDPATKALLARGRPH